MTQQQMELPAPSLQDEVTRLTRVLESERSYRLQMEKDLQKLRRAHWAYKAIDDLYKSLKRDAEYDAQSPIDDHYRDVLAVLEVIASDETACTCHVRDWHGDGHDTQCPIRVATDAHPLLRQARDRAKAGAA